MSNLEKIIAVVVDTKLLTLYRPDGSTIEIPQGDPRVRSIIDAVLPIIDHGGTAEINLDMPNSYKDFEEKTNGFVRFFKVAKKKVAHIFGVGDEAEVEAIMPGSFGKLPGSNSQKAVDKIIAQAVPANSKNFKEPVPGDDHTMIAVVKTPQGDRMIPEVEKLQDQVRYGANANSTIGMQRLLERLGAVIDKRGHSVQDVLRFLEKADLPIADSGSIIAYKILRRGRDAETFVDCHTRKIKQRVGSYVRVDEALVDRDRRNECSNGLHIARRGYIGNFGGDVCTLVEIAPEDIIAVPHGDANKVRVCGYHILAVLDNDSYNKLRSNRPMTENPKAAQLVSRAIAGKFPAAREEVRVTKQYGEGVVVYRLDGQGKKTEVTGPIKSHRALDDKRNSPERVNPADVNKQIAAVGVSRKEKIRLLMDKVTKGTKAQASEAALEILSLKKAAKVGWDVLGIDEAARQLLKRVTNMTTEAAPEAKPQVKTPPAPKPTNNQPTADQGASAQSAGGSASDTAREIVSKAEGGSNRVNTAQGHWDKIITGTETEALANGQALLDLKKKTKVSWNKLGISDEQAEQIRTMLTTKEPIPGSAWANTPEPEPEEEAPVSKKGGGSVQTQARDLLDGGHYAELVKLKRAKKKSWQALGFSTEEVAEILLHTGD